MSDIKCYYHPDDDLIPYGANVCNDTSTETGFYPCCAVGDICLPGNLCHFTHTQAGTSGYYSAACTDPSHQDPACSKVCLDLPVPDVVYNATSSLWACCGVGAESVISCADPTSETFGAPAPQVLLQSTFALLPTMPARTPTTSSVATTTTPTSSAASQPGHSINIASIGVAAVFGVIFLTLLVVGAIFLRKRRLNKKSVMVTVHHDVSKFGGVAEVQGAQMIEVLGSTSYPPDKIDHQQGYFGSTSVPRYDKPLPNPCAYEVSALRSPKPQDLAAGEPF